MTHRVSTAVSDAVKARPGPVVVVSRPSLGGATLRSAIRSSRASSDVTHTRFRVGDLSARAPRDGSDNPPGQQPITTQNPCKRQYRFRYVRIPVALGSL